MNAVPISEWLEVLGSALLHSLWQGALLWSVLLAMVAWRRNLAPHRIHLLAVGLLTLLAFLPATTLVATLVKLERGRMVAEPSYHKTVAAEVELGAPVMEEEAGGAKIAAVTGVVEKGRALDHATLIREYHSSKGLWLKSFALVWMVGVVGMALRWIMGWSWLNGIRSRDKVTVPDERVRCLMDKCLATTGLHQAAMWMSDRIGIPLLIGVVKPAVYFPARLISKLDDKEIEALLLHELAHLKRGDARWLAWIGAVETVLFFNPAVWAMAKRARMAAEQACDDLVVNWQGDRRNYAQALLSVEEWRGERMALAASGAGSSGGLKARIRRVLGIQQGDVSSPRWTLRLGGLVVAMLMAFLVLCGVGVPKLARALTDDERVALIADREKEAGLDEERNPKMLIAEGTLRAADGSALPRNHVIWAYSRSYSLATSKNLNKKIRLEGRGNWMTVVAWVEGFAPNWIKLSGTDAVDGKAGFDLTLERGFPAMIELNGDGEKAVKAKVSYQVVIPQNSGAGHVLHRESDEGGRVLLGNVNDGTRLKIDVFAHGYQWVRWDRVGFVEGEVKTLPLKRAVPVLGTVMDAVSKEPIAGARFFCWERTSLDGRMSHGYGRHTGFEMSAAPSDQEGKVVLDVCKDREVYDLLVQAPGYAETMVRHVGEGRAFHLELTPELRISGQFKRGQGKDRLKEWGKWTNWEMDGPDSIHNDSELEGDEEHLRFEIGGLRPGRGTLRSNGLSWDFELKESVRDLVLVPHHGKWMVEGEEGKLEPPKREVEVRFLSPDDSPPYEGKVTVSTGTKYAHFATVKDGRLGVEIEVPGHVSFSPVGMTGFTFVERTVRVGEAGETMPVEIPLMPAGAISGEIQVDQLKGELQVSGSLLMEDRVEGPDGSPWWPQSHGVHGSTFMVLNDGKRYFASGLPLGQKYRIQIQRGMTMVESKVLSPTRSRPLLIHDLVLPKGRTVTGQIESYDGVEVRLKYKHGRSERSWPVRVAEDRRFRLEGINFEMPGRYYVAVSGSQAFAPSWTPLSARQSQVLVKRQKGVVQDGRLVDGDGNPVPGRRLHFHQYGWFGDHPNHEEDIVETDCWSDSPTDEEGNFRVSQLRPGKYMLSVEGGVGEVVEVRRGLSGLDLPVEGRLLLKLKGN